MDKINEYCFNLMERSIQNGADKSGLTKEACIGIMNMMYGAREYASYVKAEQEIESEEDNGETMGN